ncbi:MAG: membrane protein insertase YidC [Lachnospiraceae bacterium]|nr:membrane protein insertase YidC [Lachnospiraceae bacterium]
MMFLTVQGGILGPFALLLGKLFDIIYNLLANDNGIANLGLCIIIFTVIVKLLLFPLNIKQQKSAKINSVIQPEIQKIQKKYKGKKDQESMMKQQQEVQAVYDKYGTSMTGGCLTSFIQIPIIWSLYRVIQNVPAYVTHIKDMYEPIANSVIDAKGDKASEFLINFVNDNSINGASYAIKAFEKLDTIKADNIIDVLSKFGVSHLHTLLDTLGKSGELAGNVENINKIHSFILGINISEAPGYKLSPALLIPILSALFQFLSMKVTNANNAAMGNDTAGSMAKSMQFTMPLMSLFICITLPAGIGVYWAVSAFISFLTQILINAYYDHQDMDKILEEQMKKAEEKRKKNGGKKPLMQRLMDTSAEAQEEYDKKQAMKKNSAASLKNYVPSEESKKIVEKKQNKKYKEGSIGSKANIMMNYNKEDK